MENEIVNKVAESGIVTVDLEEYAPKGELVLFDLKDHLFRGLILREKEFRTALQNLDWELYRNKYVGITCTADAIIPMWANMLVATALQPVAKEIVFGDEKTLRNVVYIKNLSKVDGQQFTDKRVVVRECGDVEIPEAAYVEITNILRPYAKSIMYGEPCSTVPIYKKR